MEGISVRLMGIFCAPNQSVTACELWSSMIDVVLAVTCQDFGVRLRVNP